MTAKTLFQKALEDIGSLRDFAWILVSALSLAIVGYSVQGSITFAVATFCWFIFADFLLRLFTVSQGLKRGDGWVGWSAPIPVKMRVKMTLLVSISWCVTMYFMIWSTKPNLILVSGLLFALFLFGLLTWLSRRASAKIT